MLSDQRSSPAVAALASFVHARTQEMAPPARARRAATTGATATSVPPLQHGGSVDGARRDAAALMGLPTPTHPIVLAQPRPRRASALKPRDEASRTKRSEKENVHFQVNSKAAMETSKLPFDPPKRRVSGDARGE